MTFHTPQVLFLILMALPWALAITHFGERKREDYYDIIDALVGPAIVLGLLYWGGFFG